MSDWELKPAEDTGLNYAERLRSIRREPSIFSAATRMSWWTAVGAVMKSYHRFEGEGRERLPVKAPFVMVANHSSHLVVVRLMLALPARLRERTFPLAAADHFFGEIPMATFTAFALNALPMARSGGGQGLESMRYLRRRLQEEGCGLVLFPEGTRSRTGKMGRFRSGLGLLVAGTTVPVIPCYIDGAFAAFPASARAPRPRRVHLVIGTPRAFPDTCDDKAGCEEVARAVEADVRANGLTRTPYGVVRPAKAQEIERHVRQRVPHGNALRCS